MSATPTQAMEGTHTPSPFELLWDRYRSLILTVVGAVFLALLGNHGWKVYTQSQNDAKWTEFAVSIGINEAYADVKNASTAISESLEKVDIATLEQAMTKADAQQKPYYLLVIARRAMMAKDWDRAERALAELESAYPQHTLVAVTENAVQTRDREAKPEDATATQLQRLGWLPAKPGNVVTLMRQEIAAEKAVVLPAGWSKPEIPATADKYQFELSDGRKFTLAVLSDRAPKLAAKFAELASQEGGSFWNGIAVDEIQRSTKDTEQPARLHLGYASTKEDDRSKWTTTEPSEHQVEYEDSGLSHFPGAISAEQGKDGKSCADRFWISCDDAVENDGSQVVFGYVVEGLDVAKSICEASLSAQDEVDGRGRPEDTIRVASVTRL